MSKYCVSPYYLRCTHCDVTHDIPCRKCDPCISLRKADLVNRYEDMIGKHHKLTMWTFGTNWQMTGSNYHLIRIKWKLFQKRLRRALQYRGSKFKWKPLFRAFEVGKNGYLHVHVLTIRQDHKIIWKYLGNESYGVQPLMRLIWGNTVGIPARKVHVNFNNGNDKKNKPKDAFRYVTKYMAKGIKDEEIKYGHYMGKPLWRPKDKQLAAKYRFENEIQGHKFEFGGVKPKVDKKEWFEEFSGKLSRRQRSGSYQLIETVYMPESKQELDVFCNLDDHVFQMGDSRWSEKCRLDHGFPIAT